MRYSRVLPALVGARSRLINGLLCSLSPLLLLASFLQTPMLPSPWMVALPRLAPWQIYTLPIRDVYPLRALLSSLYTFQPPPLPLLPPLLLLMVWMLLLLLWI